MSQIDLVRFSRDGDQFHYLWAARRCLHLLPPNSDLIAVIIEGVSPHETHQDSKHSDGDAVIDVAEYYGAEEIQHAKLIRYSQLKHSTQNADVEWQPSGLEKTLKGFSEKYRVLSEQFAADFIASKFEFRFVSNRPIAPDIESAVNEIALTGSTTLKSIETKLKGFTVLTDTQFVEFCKLLHFNGREHGYLAQREGLVLSTKSYLAGDDVDAPIRLKDLVTKKATSEFAHNPKIKKADILRALETTEDQLFPAASRVSAEPGTLKRHQESEIVFTVEATANPIVIHATGGVGKSVLAQRIAAHLNRDSIAIVYDCFGNGEYRQPAKPRHRHQDALVQIANELAALGLCDPLIPSSRADNPAYLRAFLHRANQAAVAVRSKTPTARLYIFIDAADNAEMAAQEFGQERSFARDLIRQSVPDTIRLIFLCRTERIHLLSPPPESVQINLRPFNRDETAAHLQRKFPNASAVDIDEFHRLSSENPRVQANTLAQYGQLDEALRSLGPNPTSVDDAIANQLANSIAKLRDEFGAGSIDLLCAGLAVLPPLVPIAVLARISGIHEASVQSFATDLGGGRPLYTVGDKIQFRDEPVETWFRQKYKATRQQLISFISCLEDIATENSYISSSLPALLLEAGQLDKLVAIALGAAKLPQHSPIERREIENRRLQFAFRASLRAERYLDAAKLAMKAGGEAAGNARQRNLFQSNTDVIALLLNTETLQRIVSQRQFADGWTGGHYAYEASLFSRIPELAGEARSRLRMAYDWLQNWSELPDKEREAEKIEDEDVAELVIADLFLHGAKTAVAQLERWNWRERHYRVSRLVACRLIDNAQYEMVDALADAGKDNLCIILALTIELRQVSRIPAQEIVARALRLLRVHGDKIESDSWRTPPEALLALTALIEAACKHSVLPRTDLARLLAIQLPSEMPRGISSTYSEWRSPLLAAYSLHAALLDQELKAEDLADPELRKILDQKDRRDHSSSARDFDRVMAELLPWVELITQLSLGTVSKQLLTKLIAEARKKAESARNRYYVDDTSTLDDVANMWLEVLCRASAPPKSLIQDFESWLKQLKRPLAFTTLVTMARKAARSDHCAPLAHTFCAEVHERTKHSSEAAESKVDTYTDLARALLPLDRKEAAAYLDTALQVANKLGDEVGDRWESMLELARTAQHQDSTNAQVAYRLARCGEVAMSYLHDHFDSNATLSAIMGLSLTSGLAVVGRWRDRKVERLETLLPTAITHLTRTKQINANVAAAFTAFRADWDYAALLTECLNSQNPPSLSGLRLICRYLRVQQLTDKELQGVKGVAEKHGITIPGLDDILLRSEKHQIGTDIHSGAHNTPAEPQDEKPPIDWSAIFSDMEPFSDSKLSAAYEKFRQVPGPRYFDHFWTELYSRTPKETRASLIEAIPHLHDARYYSVGEALQNIPSEWRTQLSVQTALRETLKAVFKTYRHEISHTASRYHPLPLSSAAELAGVSIPILLDPLFEAIAAQTELVEPNRLFGLVALLAKKLSTNDALNALEYALDIFEENIDEGDADGIWRETLNPPASVNEAIAGFVWACLADSYAATRWDAAHVAKALCTLECHDIVQHLVTLSSFKSGGAFSAPSLHFYDLHACLWLLIALARCSKENPQAASNFLPFLFQHAAKTQPHILLRHFAASAIASLAAAMPDLVPQDKLDKILAVNKPQEALPKKSSRKPTAKRRAREERRFSFDYDMPRYWFESLADCFDLSSDDIELQAESVIKDDWKLSFNGDWDEDPRLNLSNHRRRDYSHHQSSYPKADSLQFYLSWHSMLVVAGKLLDGTRPVIGEFDQENMFDEFLSRHILERADGKWLFDRRDPAPLATEPDLSSHQTEHWEYSIEAPYFDTLLGVGKKHLNLWSDWTAVWSYRRERVTIRSALVGVENAGTLLKALQTNSRLSNFYFPRAGGREEVKAGPYTLTGWILEPDSSSGIDALDHWSGDIRYPPPRPNSAFCDSLSLVATDEQRSWHRASDTSSLLIKTHVWGAISDNEDAESGHGCLIEVDRETMCQYLKLVQRSLIISVEVKREKGRYSDRRERGELEFLEPYCKFFLLREDGRIETLRSND